MPDERELLLSVSIRDCQVQTFRAGGKGGQNQNKVESGVRVIHPPSGARGEARDSRDQHRNRRAAFERMIATPQFRYWVQVQTHQRSSLAELTAKVDAELADPAVTVVEVRAADGWVRESPTAGGAR